MKNKPFNDRLQFALAGLREAWAKEASFRTHIVFAAIALAALFILHPPVIWWALVGVAAALVIAMELMNSAIERLSDHLHPHEHPEIKAVKDLAAAAVLVFAIAAVWVGGLMVLTALF